MVEHAIKKSVRKVQSPAANINETADCDIKFDSMGHKFCSFDYNDYNFDPNIVLKCWGWLIIWTVVYAILAVVLLEFIDKDKR